MALKFVIVSAIVAYANAGNAFYGYSAAPALAYSAAPAYASYPAPAISAYHAAPAISAYHSAPALAYNAPAITSQSSNILRSYGNLGQVSTYSKTVDTPFSSVRKADIRVSNPGVRFAAAAAPAFAYSAAPAISVGHAAPLAYSAAPAISVGHAAPLAYSAPAALGVAYSAAPAVSHINYASAYANYGW